MPKSIDNRKKGLTSDQRRQRWQQIIFGAMAIIVILSWLISLIVYR